MKNDFWINVLRGGVNAVGYAVTCAVVMLAVAVLLALAGCEFDPTNETLQRAIEAESKLFRNRVIYCYSNDPLLAAEREQLREYFSRKFPDVDTKSFCPPIEEFERFGNEG